MGVESRTAVSDGDVVMVAVVALVTKEVGGGKVLEALAGPGAVDVFAGAAGGKLQAASRDNNRNRMTILRMHHLQSSIPLDERIT